MSRLQSVVIALAACIPIGWVGAWAFNPDTGAVIHSLVLWRIFGIMFEIGLPLVLVALVATALRSLISSRSSRNIS